MGNIIIRKAVPGDEAVLAKIHSESWQAGFADILPPEELERASDLQRATQGYHNALLREDSHIAIEFVEEQPHCFAAWGKNRCDLGEHVAELICIHSLQDKWARGYGSAMMRYVLARLQQQKYESVILWVFEANLRARKFYEKHGFTLTGQKKLERSAPEVMYMKSL